jgi:hypothetical protein
MVPNGPVKKASRKRKPRNLSVRGDPVSSRSWLYPPLRCARPSKDQCGSAGVYRVVANGHMRSAMTKNDLRRKNGRLRDQIAHVVEKDPELRDVTEGIALRQDLHVEVGTPFLDRTHGKLQERAEAIIKRHPDLKHDFDE